MTIFGYRGDFKIRTKSDAKAFLQMATRRDIFCAVPDELYWNDGKTDYCLDTKDETVSERSVTERGNIFSPYFCDNDEHEAVNTIYKTRKYINARWFNED